MAKAKAKKKSAAVGDFDLDVAILGFDSKEEAEDLPDGVDVVGDCLPDREQPEDGVPETGNFEHDINAQIAQIGADLGAARRKASDRMKVALDYDTSFNVVFTSMEQRDAFLAATGWDAHGKRYLNGVDLAAKLGVKLPPCAYKIMDNKPDKVWGSFALEEDYESAEFEL